MVSPALHKSFSSLAENLGLDHEDLVRFMVGFTADRVQMPSFAVEDVQLLQHIRQLEQRIELLVLGNIEMLSAIKTYELSGVRGFQAMVDHYRSMTAGPLSAKAGGSARSGS